MSSQNPDQVAIDDVLRFWFGEPTGELDFDPSRSKIWWGGGPELDAEIQGRFGAWVERALAGDLGAWKSTARGALALVILLDQFTRSVGRGSASAFAGDPLAVQVTLAMIDSGADRSLSLVERGFLYMPLMHAEERATARRSVEVFTALSKEVIASGKKGQPDNLSHAKSHADIVERFGRYPHRNEILGRVSTPEELAFLESGGPTFGQKKKS